MQNTPDAIIVGDIHARDDQPICRNDDFWVTQMRKFDWLYDLWVELREPVVIQTGDLFHKWNSSPQVISAVLKRLPPMITIPGNPGKHNYFNMQGFEKDALSILFYCRKKWNILIDHNLLLVTRDNMAVRISPCLWGMDPVKAEKTSKGVIRDVLLTHRMIGTSGARIPGTETPEDFSTSCAKLGYDLVASGHNHQPFRYEVARPKKLHLVNPGSFTRQTASEIHSPCVYLWWATENRVAKRLIPSNPYDIIRGHIDSKEERDERITAWVEKLEKSNLEITIDILTNILHYLDTNEVPGKVRAKILEATDD